MRYLGKRNGYGRKVGRIKCDCKIDWYIVLSNKTPVLSLFAFTALV